MRSTYSVALERTADVVQQRVRNYRALSVAVVLVVGISLMWALVTRSPAGLAGLLVLLPTFGAFSWADAMLLHAWRAQLLAVWIARTLDFSALASAARADPHLPRATLEGMLDLLPHAGDLVAEQRVKAPTRRAVAAAIEATDRTRSQTALLAAVLGAVIAAAALAATLARTWVPLAAFACLTLRPVAIAWLQRRAACVLVRELAAHRNEADFDELTYARLVTSLQA